MPILRHGASGKLASDLLQAAAFLTARGYRAASPTLTNLAYIGEGTTIDSFENGLADRCHRRACGESAYCGGTHRG